MNLPLPREKSGTKQSRTPWDLNREILASSLGKSAKVLLLVIADHARHGRSKCTASTDTLAKESAMSDRHIRRLLPVLVKAGWIQIERATGSNQSRHTIFLAPREGMAPFAKLHEVGHSGACGRTNQVHEVGHGSPTKDSGRAQETSSTATLAPPEEELKTPGSSVPVVDSVPVEVVEKIASTLSKSVADEVRTHPTQFFKAAGGNWENLLAGARSVKSSQLRGIRVTNPVGLMLRQAETFAVKGVPEKFRPPAPMVVAPLTERAQLTPEQEAEDAAKLRDEIAKLQTQYPGLARQIGAQP